MSQLQAATPSQRARARKSPATDLPPRPPKRRTRARDLVLITAVGTLLIGPNVVGDPIKTHALGETSLLSIRVFDDDGQIRRALTTTDNTGVDGARLVVDGIVYTYLERSGSRPTELVFEDDASWAMKMFSSFVAYPRSRYTRAQAFRELVREASTPPLTPLSPWIPELDDRRPVAIARDGGPTTGRGTGRDASYKVKGEKANARQRRVIDLTLSEAQDLGASRRVMIATLMMKTQESRMGEDSRKTGNDDVGDSQQGRNWISLANVRDARKTTRAFLLGPDANVGGNDRTIKGWKQRFGSLRNAPGDLNAAITKVQISSGGYGQWEKECTRNVDAWLGDSGSDEVGSATFEFTRGDRDGGRENSWEASGRWAQDIAGLQRGAMLNTPYWVSEDELRAGAPALWLDGDEPWLLGDGISPSPTGPERAVKEATFRVMADEWGILPGAALRLSPKLHDLVGTWIVARVEEPMEGAATTVTIRRPIRLAAEPAPESTSGAADGGSGTLTDRLYAACAEISDQGRPYDYGGGHGPRLGSLRSTRSGLDCSSSCSLALWMVGAFPGDVAIVSGAFASSWGKPGKGKGFTVWANPGHVWIEFHGAGRDGHRFDTSPQGAGGRGPRLRTQPRSTAGFTARHGGTA